VGRVGHPALSSALAPGGGRHSPAGGKVGASVRYSTVASQEAYFLSHYLALLPGKIRSVGVFNHPSHRHQRGLCRLHPADHGSQSSTSHFATVKGAHAAHFRQNRRLVFNVQSYTPIFLKFIFFFWILLKKNSFANNPARQSKTVSLQGSKSD
jgi:hypothetical protein